MSDQEQMISHEDAVEFAAREQAHIKTKRTISIMQQNGVSQSALMGIIADVAQFSAFANAASIVALGAHGTDAQKAFIANLEVLPAATGFLTAVNTGAIRIPALEKGIEAVMDEMRVGAEAYIAAKAAIKGPQEQADA